MGEIKYTKNALREQQQKLSQLKTYLPTLQLKKKLLQFEINSSKANLDKLFSSYQEKRGDLDKALSLLSYKDDGNILYYSKMISVEKSYENIAGVELPKFESIRFEEDDYFLFDTPIWFDSMLDKIKKIIETKQKMNVEEEKKRALQKELKEVSIRVNLFEKILIPRTESNIKKIKIFLQDQELAAVSQAKIAKLKIGEKI